MIEEKLMEVTAQASVFSDTFWELKEEMFMENNQLKAKVQVLLSENESREFHLKAKIKEFDENKATVNTLARKVTALSTTLARKVTALQALLQNMTNAHYSFVNASSMSERAAKMKLYARELELQEEKTEVRLEDDERSDAKVYDAPYEYQDEAQDGAPIVEAVTSEEASVAKTEVDAVVVAVAEVDGGTPKVEAVAEEEDVSCAEGVQSTGETEETSIPDKSLADDLEEEVHRDISNNATMTTANTTTIISLEPAPEPLAV
eukprot:CAMPEP_0118716464 /NCGR_PEP_ID=MMETSP0800-20121206/27509_1 /TAXON_ID=210618 ORGANISM="Striatella unipunctata, Strain CCMP2910" /NCGR_SAMPLE_ID=MMETSP0800 /ASSEMBLY_ACC=CAM_ASM_000638 /LENGTH=261 /DNA_ID=CAMNT_0006622875 /DNA_START=8 /DNA_END=792 /DNA_ORIENTATION=-